MIKLEIFKSNDPLALGIYDYLFDQIYIGRSKNCDLIFQDTDLPLYHLQLSMVDLNLTVQNNLPDIFYYINSKKTSGLSILKKNDILSFGFHHLKILNFEKTLKPTDLTIYFEKKDSLPPTVLSALSYIEEKLLDFEKVKDV